MKKKLLIILFILLSLTGASFAQSIPVTFPDREQIALLAEITPAYTVAGATVCTIGSGANWVNADTNVDYWGPLATNDSQLVANTGSKSICKILVNLSGTAGQTTHIYLTLRSAIGGGGTLYGTSDAIDLVDADWGLRTFNFSTPVVVPGDFYITFTVDNAYSYIRSSASAKTYFGESTVNLYAQGAGNRPDMLGEIWYLQ